MRIIARILILLISILGFSQGVSAQKPSATVISFTPLSLINPTGSNIQLGAELIRGKWSYGSDIAVYLSHSSKKGDYRIADRLGFKIRPEIRYYFKPRLEDEKPHLGFYVANELLFIKDHYKRGDRFMEDWDTPEGQRNYFYDYDIIRRYEFGSNFKLGYQSILWKRLTLDWFTGIGIKYINATYEYRVPYETYFPLMRFFEPPTYNGFRPWFSLGVKIGVISQPRAEALAN